MMGCLPTPITTPVVGAFYRRRRPWGPLALAHGTLADGMLICHGHEERLALAPGLPGLRTSLHAESHGGYDVLRLSQP